MEITRRCHLACRHCRGDSRDTAYPDELRLDEITRIIDSIAPTSGHGPILIITGGEPLTRPDVYDIARHAVSRGLRAVLATCGHLLDEETVTRLLDAGIARISVSIDGATASTHDSFRGVPGAYDAALRGIGIARRLGLPFQVNSTLTALNIDEFEAIHDLVVSLGAEAFHPFLLVPMGRGKALAPDALDAAAYEDALARIARVAAASPLEINPTCSPHYIRVSGDVARREGLKLPRKPHGHGRMGSGHPPATDTPGRTYRGCLGGQGFVFVSHTGTVQPCGFLELPAGELRDADCDLGRIWAESPLFNELRDRDSYTGDCGACHYLWACGGCRARAYYATDNYMAEEPNCLFTPGTNTNAD
jgi:AdoMet-dependent heme synthase